MKELRPYEELFDTHPLLRLVVPFAFGISFAELTRDFLVEYNFVFACLTFLFLALAIFVSASRRKIFGKVLPFLVLLNLVMFSLGVTLQLSEVKRLQIIWPTTEQVYRAVIIETPKSSEKVWQTTARISGGTYDGNLVRLAVMKHKNFLDSDSISKSSFVTENKVSSSLADDSLLTGDVLLLHTQICAPQNSGNPDEFDFAGWLRHQGISGTAFCFPSQWKKSEQCLAYLPLKIRLQRWRDILVGKYKDYFEGRELAVLAAMTLGDKTHLDAATRDVFSHTGVSHVLALSGFHLSVLFSIYQFLVLSLCRPRRLYTIMSLLGIGGLWMFAFLAGLPLSLIRAAVMFTIVQLLSCFRRDSFSLNNLSLAAILLLLFSPQSLFDVGFQLSFLSVFTIILFSKSIPSPSFIKRFPILNWFYSLFVVSFCAQLGTAPLVAYYFHTFPVYGWISNFVAVPLAYLILGVGLLFFVLPFARSFLAVILGGSLHLMDGALTFLSELPGAVLELYPTLLTVVLVYLCFYITVRYCLRHCASRLYTLSLVVVSIFGIEFYVHRPHKLEPQIIFYNLRGVPVVHALVSAGNSYVWSTRKSRADSALVSVQRTFWKKEKIRTPHWLTSKVQNKDIYYDEGLILFNGCRVALLTNPLPFGHPQHPLPVDYLLLGKGVTAPLKKVLTYYAPKCIILDGSLSDYYWKKYVDEINNTDLDFYDMKSQGALRINFN